ncbi:ATP-dependent DNA ligase [bacterium]|nr:ATP-dependent DNA ligase [bacterium]
MPTRTYGGRTIETSREDKVLFPDSGITKGDLVEYYEKVADTLLPYLEERPVTMKRYPEGINGFNFFQKDKPDHFPDWIETETVPKEDGTVDHVIVNDLATLVYLVQQACITPHVWLGTRDDLRHPDRMILDLDPPGDRTEDFALVREAALDLQAGFKAMELPLYVMTSGSKGLHLWTSLDRTADYDTVRGFGEQLAEALSDAKPDRYTVAKRKDQRKGRLFIDYLRNSYAQTSAPPYAVRARPGAPVATPLDWNEVTSDLGPRRYTVKNLLRRLGQKGDPWKGMERRAVALTDTADRIQAFRAALETG